MLSSKTKLLIYEILHQKWTFLTFACTKLVVSVHEKQKMHLLD
ncbi:hypothetical protein BSCG_05471 [Bacteroides sp. 2_2_4]|uniref:Uncharacterized protein n=1 Tax=Bacteroides ovatus (strain ATCC 8483 / DSM 1896 / JCM 5824 / BCRC 10623 / CCUG 4943 / NCTC 11153) TaxID=411476 RepID=A0AAN3A2Y9_BACO1|nr:hypothetical protein BACOVA_04899 [Bacteroides ovatus ATCC 8483]EEO58541.1 hypothetical protein BSCG_05471 [Bacteroides sp. 2_2_4]EEZ03021.1 hypothetical protein HMPREF0102_03337 [Bacteroides sp. 2_1_22]